MTSETHTDSFPSSSNHFWISSECLDSPGLHFDATHQPPFCGSPLIFTTRPNTHLESMKFNTHTAFRTDRTNSAKHSMCVCVCVCERVCVSLFYFCSINYKIKQTRQTKLCVGETSLPTRCHFKKTAKLSLSPFLCLWFMSLSPPTVFKKERKKERERIPLAVSIVGRPTSRCCQGAAANCNTQTHSTQTHTHTQTHRFLHILDHKHTFKHFLSHTH